MDLTKIYVKDATGKFYEEIQNDDGEYEYIPADPKLQFEELTQVNGRMEKEGIGKYIEVRDRQERARQREADSHLKYFEELSKDPDPKKARQGLKRIDQLEKQLTQLVIDRASPVGVPHVERIKDEQFLDMLNQYKKDVESGESKSYGYTDTEFLPLSAYQHKLVTRTGKMIRPLYAGEVGMKGSTIYVLEEGFGTGNLVQVK